MGEKFIHIGCGDIIIKNFKNFDNSISIIISRLPLIATLLFQCKVINKKQYDYISFCKSNNILFMDVRKKFPFPDESIDIIYTSHMLEHLTKDQASFFLYESKRVLRKGGFLRIVIPDLEKLIHDYSQNKDAEEFMDRLYMYPPQISKLLSKIKLFFSGYRQHQFMYDTQSIKKLTAEIFGLKNVYILKPGETNITLNIGINLYEREQESIFIEIRK